MLLSLHLQKGQAHLMWGNSKVSESEKKMPRGKEEAEAQRANFWPLGTEFCAPAPPVMPRAEAFYRWGGSDTSRLLKVECFFEYTVFLLKENTINQDHHKINWTAGTNENYSSSMKTT